MGEDNNEDRLTKNEFSELIQHLSMQEVLSIEYLVGNDWAKLFTRKSVAFNCNICVVEASSFKNLLDHINGKRHKFEMRKVKQLYHPDYTYPKSATRETIVGKSSQKNANALTAAISTESGCNDRQEKIEKGTNNGKMIVKNPEVPTKKKNIQSRNLIEIKPTLPNKQSILLTTSANGKEKEYIKSNEHDVIEKEIHKELKETNEISLKGKERHEEEVPKNNQNSNVEKNNKKSNLSTLKNAPKENTLNCESKSEKEISEEVMIISESEENSQENVEEENLGNGSINPKATKIVINPVAALAVKKNTSNIKEQQISEDTNPIYQTNKIIIPTANKINDEKNSSSNKSQSDLGNLPKFSVKSYTSKSDDVGVHGILGVEYVIKILRYKNDPSPRYECGLCEIVLDGFAMQRHLEGYNHRLKFCEKHFPTAIRLYRQYMQSVPEHEIFKVMTPVLEKLAKAIENHHGRNLPYECYERDFSMNRHEILAKAFSCRHASEQYGPTFTHVVGANEVDDYIKRRQNYTPPTASRFAIFDNKHGESAARSDSMRHQDVRNTDKISLARDRNRHADREVTNYLIRDKDNSHKSYMSSGLIDDLRPPASFYNQSNSGNVLQHVDDKTYNQMVDNFLKGTLKGMPSSSKLSGYQKRSASPSTELNSKRRKSLSPLRDNDIWQAYRHMVDQELNKLDEKFKHYRKDPETHPSYNEEWQKFWKRRKDELISAGLDHRNYNYQPEWVKFIKVRTEELYNEEVESIKIKCRERLCLPMTNSHLLHTKYHVAATSNDCLKAPLSVNIQPVASLETNLSAVASSKADVPQVVSVLRLMTALEDSLGSLGPKIIDLLSKALQAEKSDPPLINAVILTPENCSLIDTAKEKLKGLVITGLFEGSKARVLHQVISDTEKLLKYAYQNRQFLSAQRNSDSTRRLQNCTSLTQQPLTEVSTQFLEKAQTTLSSAEISLLNTDKKELASKLAASLVAQGKTDFDPQQLQQLIAVYTLIEKKKRESSSFSSSKETTSISKKKLSDTLSDLLKSSTSTQSILSADRTSISNINMIKQKQLSNSNVTNATATTSFNSVLQNAGDNYLTNSTNPQFSESFHGLNSTRGNQFVQHSDYNSNSANIRNPYHENSIMSNAYNNNNPYQNNNRIVNNWMLNSNRQMSSNYAIGKPNGYNQSTNWRNF